MTQDVKLEEKQVDQDSTVEIEDAVIIEKPEIDLTVLDAKEQELAKTHFKQEEKNKDDEHKELQTVAGKTSNKEQETEKGKEEVKKPATFEEVEDNEEGLKDYNPNEKALYWKWKNDKRKRQDAQKKTDELQARLELNTIKDNVSANKLKKINDILSGDAGEITVEALRAIIEDNTSARQEDSKPITKADLDRIENEKNSKVEQEKEAVREKQERLSITEKIGKEKYENFDELVQLANEVVNEDATGTYKDILAVAFNDANLDEEKLIDRVVTFAKLNSKFGKSKPDGKPEDKKKIEKIITNSNKKISSTTINSSGGKRSIVESELTIEDAQHLSTDQWLKLSLNTRKRLLGG